MTEATEALSPQADAPEPAKGLDAILSSAIEKSGYGEEAKPAEKPADVIETPKEDRPRDASGRFLPKESADAKPSDTEPAKAEAKPAETVATEPPAPEPIQPPARWSDADKAEFAKLAPEAQKLLLARYSAIEGDYTRKTQEIAETRKAFEPVVGEIQRLNPLLQHMGMTPQQFIAESGAVANNLLSGNPQQRANAIAYLVQHRQVPVPELLNALGIPLPPGAEGLQMQRPDPAVSQLHQTVSGLQAQLRQMTEQRELEERQRAQAEFDALGQAKDQNGQPKFPHFERVRNAMIQLVASNQADTWDAAYIKAVRLDDELYKQTVEAERQRVAAEAEKARLEAVEKAKKAQPVKSSDGAPKGGQQLKGLDAHLSAAIERMGVGG